MFARSKASYNQFQPQLHVMPNTRKIEQSQLDIFESIRILRSSHLIIPTSKNILYNDMHSIASNAEEGNIKRFYRTTKDASAYAFSD